MTIETKINSLLDLFFKRDNIQFDKKEIDGFNELLSNGIIKKHKKNTEIFTLNSYSKEFNTYLLKFIERKTKKELPKNVSEAFKYIEDFKDDLRKKHKINITNAYDIIVKGFKIFILQKFKNENIIEPVDFLFELEKTENRNHYLYNYESIFFMFLHYSDYTTDEIAEICIKSWNNKLIESSIISFLRDYANTSIDRANKLLNDLNEKDIQIRMISHILIGLYNAGDNNALEKAIKLKDSNLLDCFFILGRLNYSSEKEIEKIFKLIEPLNFANKEIASEQSYLIFQIINNSKATKDLKKKGFGFLVSLLEKATPEIIENVFHGVINYLKNYEAEKYDLLSIYLSKTKNFGVIKNFFFNFKNPKYLFDLLIHSFSANPNYRFPIEIFESGIHHAWQNNKEETEKLILSLFNQHPAFSILAVKIILVARRDIYKIDLLKLENKNAQINAIKGFCKSPVFFDRLLPVLLSLRNSIFKEVKDFLRQELAHKVFNSYHETIYELIVRNIGNSKKDKQFILPIKKALDAYFELKKLKESIKDIDPIENERDLMELYYRLDREEQAKMMNKINEGEGTFMQFVKNTVIVRGNAWKIGSREISPLGNFESKMLVDGSSYLNPDLFEHNMNTI